MPESGLGFRVQGLGFGGRIPSREAGTYTQPHQKFYPNAELATQTSQGLGFWASGFHEGFRLPKPYTHPKP